MLQINGTTGIKPKPTYPNGTYDFSLALLDMWVAYFGAS